MSDVFDLVVVGGGTAGLVAAKTAAGFGARVGLVERERTGGDCLWTGCVPSKALLAAARAAQSMRSPARFGIAPVEPKVDFPAVMAHVRAAIDAVEPNDSPRSLRETGVTVAQGEARFAGAGRVWAGARLWRFRRALVATGSEPAVPPIPGLTETEPLTSDTVWGLRELPGRLIVLGGGPVGCELAQAFARLGSEVTIVEAAERLLPREEPGAGETLATRLEAEGVAVRTASTVTAVDGTPGALRVEVSGSDGTVGSVPGDRVLVATGRTPRTTGLGLDTVGARTDEHGYLAVDARLRTSNRRIYAAGDVTGGPAFTHVAGVAGSIAATNSVLAPLRRIDSDRMPWVIFTDPEVAHVGLTEAQARARHGDGVRARVTPHGGLDRAITESSTDGFTHIVLDRRGRVLGATIVAPRAAEMLTELTAAVTDRRRLRDLASVTHPYPAWGDAVWHTAVTDLREALRTPVARRATETVLRLNRAVTASAPQARRRTEP